MRPLSVGDGEISKESNKELRDNRLNRNPFVAGEAYEVTAGENGIVRLYTRFKPRGVMVVEAPFLCAASIAQTKNNITTVRLTRQWEFLERYEASRKLQSFNFDVDVKSTTDTDYKIEGYWVAYTLGETGPNLYWYINGTRTGMSNEGSDYTFSAATTDGVLLSRNPSTDGSHYIMSTLTVEQDKRFAHTHTVNELGNLSSNINSDFIASKWNDTETITRLGVSASVSQGIDVGSVFDLYRRPQFNKTKLTLWVY